MHRDVQERSTSAGVLSGGREQPPADRHALGGDRGEGGGGGLGELPSLNTFNVEKREFCLLEDVDIGAHRMSVWELVAAQHDRGR